MSKNPLNLTTDQARAIAFLATTIAPNWHQTATMNAIAEAQAASLPLLAYGVLAAAADPEAKTPSAMNFADRGYFTGPKPITNAPLRLPSWQPEPKPDVASPETVAAKCAALRTHLATRTPVPNCHCQPACTHADCGCATTHHQRRTA